MTNLRTRIGFLSISCCICFASMGRKCPSRRKQGVDVRQGAPSRHQSALLKKFRELSALCAIENALVIFDPDGEPFAVGQACPKRPIAAAFYYPPSDHDATLRELNKQYYDVLKQLEAEEKKAAKLEEQRKEWMRQNNIEPNSWIDKPVEQMTLEELESLKPMMEELCNKLKKTLRERTENDSAQILLTAEEASTSGSAVVGGDAPADDGP